MPELPEVETTRRGLIPLITNRFISSVNIYRPKLRWDIPMHLIKTLSSQEVKDVQRRGKYLLIKFDVGTLIIHLGMSGSISVVNSELPLKKHDHFELNFNNNTSMRLNDPRRFGAVLFSIDGKHKLLDSLGPEPLTSDFGSDYLYEKSRNKKQNVKAFIMDSKVVVGVGNIYACESLFMAKLSPEKQARDVSRGQYQFLTKCIKEILETSINAGGTTLKDFSKVDGSPGYFTQTLSVYGRDKTKCDLCNNDIIRIVQNQRSTFLCPKCQPL